MNGRQLWFIKRWWSHWSVNLLLFFFAAEKMWVLAWRFCVVTSLIIDCCSVIQSSSFQSFFLNNYKLSTNFQASFICVWYLGELRMRRKMKTLCRGGPICNIFSKTVWTAVCCGYKVGKKRNLVLMNTRCRHQCTIAKLCRIMAVRTFNMSCNDSLFIENFK